MKKKICPFNLLECREECALYDCSLKICSLLGQHITNVLIGEKFFDIVNVLMTKAMKKSEKKKGADND